MRHWKSWKALVWGSRQGTVDKCLPAAQRCRRRWSPAPPSSNVRFCREQHSCKKLNCPGLRLPVGFASWVGIGGEAGQVKMLGPSLPYPWAGLEGEERHHRECLVPLGGLPASPWLSGTEAPSHMGPPCPISILGARTTPFIPVISAPSIVPDSSEAHIVHK